VEQEFFSTSAHEFFFLEKAAAKNLRESQGKGKIVRANFHIRKK